jgi:hypothetical protein
VSAFRRLDLVAIGLATAVGAWITPAFAQSNSSAEAPYAAKAIAIESLRLPADHSLVTSVMLGPVEPSLIDAARQANSEAWNKRLQIGIGRPVDSIGDASSESLHWTLSPPEPLLAG